MSRSSNLELTPTDSQVLGSLDSVSLPSEPPDIRNWFSSYVYESPELNMLDGLQNLDGSAETLNKAENKAKSGKCRNLVKIDDALVSGDKGLLDEIVECNESDKFEHSKPTVMVSRLSESLSQCSEPPDIKNWFSSYVYESPPLDTTDGFTISDYKEREYDSVYNSQMSCRENEKDLNNFINVGENIDLRSQSRISAAVLKCTNLVKDTDNQSISKDDHNVDLNPGSSLPSQWSSESVSEQMLPGQIMQNQNHCSVEMFKIINTGCEDYNTKLLNLDNDTANLDGKFLNKSIEEKDRSISSLEKKDLDEHVFKGIGKENELLEDGFVSTRKKSKQTNTENRRRPLGGQSESIRSRAKYESNYEKNAKITRRVLSDATNLHLPNIPETTGKWRCPQKGKPDLGPPLKQLRLEQWIRRV
ncbi:hypothetical protein ACJIZ3_003893 [Penstemon smallii]|uniref:Uncharacterized protein n=1 Tax=Penstemon smallii TaxID=265156 RepID=A0ABD3S0I0_9LAMI